MKMYEFTYTNKRGETSERRVLPLEETDGSILGLDVSKLTSVDMSLIGVLYPQLETMSQDAKITELKAFNHALRRFLRPSIAEFREVNSETEVQSKAD